GPSPEEESSLEGGSSPEGKCKLSPDTGGPSPECGRSPEPVNQVENSVGLAVEKKPAKPWDRPIGVTTGYRWLIPTPRTNGSIRYGSALVAGVNGAVAVLFGKHSPTFVWGGAWAISRDLFDRLEIRRHWRGRLSDDMTVRHVLIQSGYRSGFEPGAVVVGECDHTFLSGFRFIRRQYQFVRHTAPGWWWFALMVLLIGQLAFWIPLFGWCISGDGGPSWWMVGGLWGGMVILKTVIALRIRWAERSVGGRGAYGPLAGLYHLSAVLAAGFGHRILWRGVRYTIHDRRNDR
ncbi:MAG: hypothetical protein Q4C47_06750, partial [Planctomycetia bacterium]|nr:hypothetical protein [Planctomycetia bacterium]